MTAGVCRPAGLSRDMRVDRRGGPVGVGGRRLSERSPDSPEWLGRVGGRRLTGCAASKMAGEAGWGGLVGSGGGFPGGMDVCSCTTVAMIIVCGRKCSETRHFRPQTVMGVAPLKGVVDLDWGGGSGVAGGASEVVVSAMKAAFRTLNVPKVTFMASDIVTGEPPTTATPPVTKARAEGGQPPDDRQLPPEEPHPIAIMNRVVTHTCHSDPTNPTAARAPQPHHPGPSPRPCLLFPGHAANHRPPTPPDPPAARARPPRNTAVAT
jgi:hypothetical protein